VGQVPDLPQPQAEIEATVPLAAEATAARVPKEALAAKDPVVVATVAKADVLASEAVVVPSSAQSISSSKN
jgi:hypothetical protein